MARHITPRPRSRMPRALMIAGAGMIATVVIVGVVASTSSEVDGLFGRSAGAACPSSRLPSTTLSVAVAPELLGTVRGLLAPTATRPLAPGRCLKIKLKAQDPEDAAANAELKPIRSAPDVWIPDSSLWAARVPQWKPHQIGAVASSPVVIATSRQSAVRMGWHRKAPTWAEALCGTLAVALPDIASDASGLSAVIAMYQGLGAGDKAQQALAGVVLGTLRSGAPGLGDALEAAAQGSATTPVIPISERAVRSLDAAARSHLVVVRPTGGAPALDYPMLEIAGRAGDVGRQTAVRTVVSALSSADARAAFERAGLITPASGPRASAAAGSAATGTPPASAPDIGALLQRISLLSAPSRVLMLVDASRSMAASAGNGMTRIGLAEVAAKATGNLMPDRAQIGLWAFSRNLRGGADRVEMEPVAALGSTEGGRQHRDALDAGALSLSRQLGGDGRALYASTVAGIEQMGQAYQARAGNAVVVFTDGGNQDPGGPTLKATVARLRELYDPDRPVRLICVGIGPTADMPGLRALAEAAGGTAYTAQDPSTVPRVVFQTISRTTSTPVAP